MGLSIESIRGTLVYSVPLISMVSNQGYYLSFGVSVGPPTVGTITSGSTTYLYATANFGDQTEQLHSYVGPIFGYFDNQNIVGITNHTTLSLGADQFTIYYNINTIKISIALGGYGFVHPAALIYAARAQSPFTSFQCGLLTSMPTASNLNGTELSAPGYSRVNVSVGSQSMFGSVEFTCTSTSGWPQINGVGIWASGSHPMAGTLIYAYGGPEVVVQLGYMEKVVYDIGILTNAEMW